MTERTSIQSQTRTQIAAFLPAAIEKATQSYRDYMDQPFDSLPAKSGQADNAVGFVERHKGAKVALAHIELLIKLAKWADLPDTQVEGSREAAQLAQLLAAAQAELDETAAL